jgi:hypothetical protein
MTDASAENGGRTAAGVDSDPVGVGVGVMDGEAPSLEVHAPSKRMAQANSQSATRMDSGYQGTSGTRVAGYVTSITNATHTP